MADLADKNGQSSQESKPHDCMAEIEKSVLFKAVYAFVRQYMSRFDCSHDFSHILRVLASAKYILAEELSKMSSRKLDQEAVLLCALLHDVGDKKYIQSGENSEQLISNLLFDHGCDKGFVDKIIVITEHVSYSNEVKQPQAVAAVLAEHPELAIVQDADRLDAIGAIGIGRCFAYGAAKQPDRGLDGSIDHFTEKLENIELMMKTETGRRLARDRTQRLKMFRHWWTEERDLGTDQSFAP